MQIIGHRGGLAENGAVENTVEQMRRGVELGLTAVEFDLRTTRDGFVVVNHDPWLLCDKTVLIARTNLQDLKKRTRRAGYDIATLDEMLAALAKMKTNDGAPIKLDIEFKRLSAIRPALKILKKHLKSLNRTSRPPIVFSSFWPLQLLRLKRLAPQVPRALLLVQVPILPRFYPLKLAKKLFKIKAVGVADKFFWPGLARRAKKSGLKFYVYTAGRKADDGRKFLRAAARQGLAAAIVNSPSRVLKWQKADADLRRPGEIV
ncbi:MAG: glycerophosphodiester phosphodiesterase [Candidatus Nomurabacteria bacterium]|jgi:glycerophosphoryl diester phosphodiesterase|nr:glycerophosphodiester phosphodiesterase [Candidatus Nomurabacteria bacterium]